jgi:membrane protein required for colicin V production
MGSLPMNDILSMNPFDAAVYLCLFVAVVMGFVSGLLRSLATIFGYVAALGLAVAATPRVASAATTEFNLPPAQA